MSDRIRFVVYACAVYAVLGAALMAASFAGREVQPADLALLVVIGPLAAAIAMAAQHAAAGGLTRLMTGLGGVHEPVPALSKARFHMKHERWTEARDELDIQWLQFPGHRDVLMELERCYVDGLRAAAAFVDFLVTAAPQCQGETRAYVFLRIAELNADALGRKDEALGWCRRLLAEFPASRHADTARRLREQLEPASPAAGA